MNEHAGIVRNGKLPCLDGLRAVSIVLVLLGHLYGTTGYGSSPGKHLIGNFSHFGVVVFFVISGFLITTLLLQERARTQSTDLLAFYIRRALRIMPAFLFFIACMAVADYVGWISLTPTDYVHALTYTVNYTPSESWNLAHLWSLSVEEQFYLLWPFLFSRLSPKQAIVVAVATVAAAPVIRTAMHITIPPGLYRDLPIFPAVADAIAIGCLMALGRPWLLAKPAYLRFTESPAMLGLLVPVYFVNQYSGYTLVDLLGTPILLVSVAVAVEASTRHGDSTIGRMLNSRPAVTVGLLSYSLYLWQQPFLNRAEQAAATAFPANILLAVSCAVLSYLIVERPVLNLRRRWVSRPIQPANLQ
jgi:peptidoglycan/LPS O-acetylase OafA/YrhL